MGHYSHRELRDRQEDTFYRLREDELNLLRPAISFSVNQINDRNYQTAVAEEEKSIDIVLEPRV